MHLAQNLKKHELPIWGFCLALNLPFLLPWHELPFPSFGSEFSAYVIGLSSVLGLFLAHASGSALVVPRNILAPIFFLFIVCLQWLLGMFSYSSTAIVMSLVSVWLAFVMIAGATLKSIYGLQYLVNRIAISVLFCTVLNGLIGVLQYLGFADYFAGLIASPMPLSVSGVYGNIAQQNHYATYLSFGLAALVYLFLSARIASLFVLPSLLTLLLGLFLSASRSAYIYALCLLVLTSLAINRFDVVNGKSIRLENKGRWKPVAWCVASVLLLAILVSRGLAMPQLERLTTLTESLGARYFLWQHSLKMFLSSPILGVGVDAYAWQLTEQIGSGDIPNSWGVDQYAHNIVLQLLATTGLLGFVSISIALARSIPWHSWRRWSYERLFIGSILVVVVIHSSLEQPLYFVYFLTYAALCLSFTDDQPWRVVWGTWTKLSMIILSALMLMYVCHVGFQYKRFERIFNQSEPNLGLSIVAMDDLRYLHQSQVLQPWIEGFAPELVASHDASTAEKLQLNRRLIRFAPLPENMYRHAALLAENGEPHLAKQQLRKAILVYPDLARMYLQRFRSLEQENPELYAELSAFAEQEIDLYLKR